MPLNIIFIDALKKEYLHDMPLLNNFADKNRIAELQTTCGYSSAAHMAIWTGCHPQHNGVFLPYYSKEYQKKGCVTFTWTKVFRRISSHHLRLLAKYAVSKSLQARGKRNGFLPGIDENTYQMICYEKTDTLNPQNMTVLPTLFSLLTRNKTSYHYYRSGNDSTEHWKKENVKDEVNIFYTALIDISAQTYGTHSERFKNVLRTIDRKLLPFIQQAKHQPTIFFSDHGMRDTRKVIDPQAHLHHHGCKDYTAIFDSTFARFWTKNEKTKRQIKTLFQKNEDFEYLDQKKQKRYHINFGNKFGDLIFLAKPGIVIAPNPIQKILKVRMKAMHGYSPDCKDMDAVLVTNIKLTKKQGHIIDILPTILKSLKIKSPKVDGISLI